MADKNISHKSLSIAIQPYIEAILWKIVDIAIKAYLLMYLINGLLAEKFEIPIIEFGNAFAIVTIIQILFSNIDNYNKLNSTNLLNIQHLLYSFAINQYQQNKEILDKLGTSNVPSIDNDTKKNYNTEQETEN